jgi:hypothetical protein
MKMNMASNLWYAKLFLWVRTAHHRRATDRSSQAKKMVISLLVEHHRRMDVLPKGRDESDDPSLLHWSNLRQSEWIVICFLAMLYNLPVSFLRMSIGLLRHLYQQWSSIIPSALRVIRRDMYSKQDLVALFRMLIFVFLSVVYPAHIRILTLSSRPWRIASLLSQLKC